MGEKLTKRDFNKLIKSNNISKDVLDYNFKHRSDCSYPPESSTVYETITCPHCNTTSTGKPSAFKRWHFNNCKFKKDE